MATYLPPVEKPSALFIKLGYFFSRRKFGRVFTPLSVFNRRMPSAFAFFYMKIPKLDKKLSLSHNTAQLIRQWVASVNGCLFCMDAGRYAALRKSMNNEAKFDALQQYGTSPLFTDAERAALDYVTELTRDRKVNRDTFDRMARHYSEREICEIVWIVASEHLYNLTNIGLNIGSEGFCDVLKEGIKKEAGL